MKDGFKIFGGILFLILVIGLFSQAVGWISVFSTRTVGKAKQDAQREVFESTQSHVEGMRRQASKYYIEFKQSTAENQRIIATVVSEAFVNFDVEKIKNISIRNFVKNCIEGTARYKNE